MSKMTNAPTKRLCGHTDLFSYGSKGRVGLMSDSLYASNSLCGECRASIRQLHDNCPRVFFPLDLPLLAGTYQAIRYAKGLRLNAIRYAGPVMARLKAADDPLAKLALTAYELLFQITSSKYWISFKDQPFDSGWVTAEIEALLRKSNTSFTKFGPTSSYGYWLLNDPMALRRAKDGLGIGGDIAGEKALVALLAGTGVTAGHGAPGLLSC